ncbi:MAG: acyl-[acyl-carrier-protein] thioesterase [Spirochaetota bacterium]
MNAPKRYADTISVPSMVTDTRDRLTVPGIAKLFEELAWQHARRLGVDFTDGGYHFWVLSRLRVRVESLPRWSQQVSLETWPSGVSRLFACREFRVAGDDGTDLIRGTSRWLVMSSSSGRPVPPGRALDLSLIPTSPAILEEEPEKLTPEESAQPASKVTVRYSDLDRNQHTNNTRYVVWMLDTLAPEMHERHVIADFDMNFTAESHYHDELTVMAAPVAASHQEGTLEFRSHIVRDRDGAVVAIGRFTLAPADARGGAT